MTRRNVTERYFIGLVTCVIGEKGAPDFIREAKEKYGEEWWSEWVGLSVHKIKTNIKDIYRTSGNEPFR
ncbi:MAG: hypothetical protein ACLP51_10600 [Syntrophobacteraceae bacterium]